MFSCCNHLLPSAFDNLFTSGCLALGGWVSPMSLVWILKRLLSVLILNGSRRYRKLNENSLSLSEFYKRGIAMLFKDKSFTSPFTVKWSTFNILRLTDMINREGTLVYFVRVVGRSVVRLPGPWSPHCRHGRIAYIKIKT